MLESRIVRELDARGYFVEPSQVLRDARTGKSREIDVVAEYYNHVPDHKNVCVKTHFVAEVVNNRYPVVLLTRRPLSPNSSFESYVKFGTTPSNSPFYEEIDIYGDRGPSTNALFAQYCALSTKKGEQKELMASHPEDLYGSLQKLAEYVEEELQSFDEWTTEEKSEIWRLFFWHPMLVVGGQLFAVAVDEASDPTVREVESAFLEFNWHQGEDRKTTVIEFVQLKKLYERMAEIVAWDKTSEEKINAFYKRTHPRSADA